MVHTDIPEPKETKGLATLATKGSKLNCTNCRVYRETRLQVGWLSRKSPTIGSGEATSAPLY